MKGLLYKEWAILTSSYKQSVFFIAFLYGGISILTGQTGMAYALLVVFSILITSTISFDENSHWDIYARTLPVTPAQLVGSKYLFGLCGLALGTVCTVLIVAQRISTILNAEQIIVLDDGKIAGKGTHEELIASCDIYREIYETQFKKEEA